LKWLEFTLWSKNWRRGSLTELVLQMPGAGRNWLPSALLSLKMTLPSAHWRLLVTSPATGAENMALDEALMERARMADDWTLRVYSWSEPTLSLGRNQTARGRYDLERVRERGLGVVRRPTGGRAILHHREVTYSVTAPTASAGELGESYRRINRLLLAAMRSLGVTASVAAPATRAISPGMSPCFDEPAAGELVVDGRKLAGSAQWRIDGALLQHGSILVADDQSALAELAVGGQASIPKPATLTEALGWKPTVGDVAEALHGAVRMLEDPTVSSIGVDSEVRARMTALVVRYSDDAWTWRR
jgi:lipoate-protein ligase A